MRKITWITLLCSIYLFIIRIFAMFLQPVCTTTGGKVYTDLKFHFHLSSWADDTVKSCLVFSRLWSKGRPHWSKWRIWIAHISVCSVKKSGHQNRLKFAQVEVCAIAWRCANIETEQAFRGVGGGSKVKTLPPISAPKMDRRSAKFVSTTDLQSARNHAKFHVSNM